MDFANPNAFVSDLKSERQLAGGARSVLQTYLRIAQRWRWLIIGTVLACTLIGIIVTFLTTPKYTTNATIEISREADQVTTFQGVERETSVADQEFYQTQYGLLRSRSLAERIAVQLRFVDSPAFFALFDAASDDPAFTINGGRYPASGRATRQRVAGETLMRHFSVEPVRLSRLVNIFFTSPDPEVSAQIANAWGENFIQTNLERKVQATSYGRNQLQHQLADYKERLDASQRQLVAYASANHIINLPSQASGDGTTTQERSIVADNLAALNKALTDAIADRVQAEARFRERRGASAASSLTNLAINSLRQRRAELAAEYQELMARFKPDYPAAQALESQINDLDQSIAREERRVTGSVDTAAEGEYRQALSREQALQSRVEALKSDYLDLRRRSIQYNIYQQEVDTNRALYDGLLQRFKEIGIAGGVGVNNIAIVDQADIPQKPSSPKLLVNLLLSGLLGLILGAATAWILEQIDERIIDPGEVERELGLPLLGTVPKVVDQTPREVLLDRKSDLVDAYLAIQTNLGFTTEHGVPRSFAVTSTRPAEGKSTTALSLATTLSRGNRKVIVVDADMRSPSIHHLGGVDNDRGLSNYLAGDDNIQALLFTIEDLGLTAMSAGPIPPNAAELLTGARMTTLLTSLLQTYDHVVVDAPPVMGLADAPLIASKVEGVVYAVEAHGIRITQVQTALARLASANVRILGGVLTKFESKKAHYGYGYEYGYGYGRDQHQAEPS